ncbi:MAG TPA: outer membrane beta-barrel protein [Bryobacteraceae bacterium]|nr:outer membrane beta-barrel protein [Bryobacteraceae bacterium]
MFRIAMVGCLLAGSAYAQFPVSVGVKGGVALTDAFESSSFLSGDFYPIGEVTIRYYSPSKDYLVGPFVELRLPFNLSVEADALYRKLNFASVQTGVTTPFRDDDNTWEFPILAKYRFKLPVARPYVDAGPSFRTSAFNAYGTSLSNHGFAAGAGVDIKALLLHVSPEVRYTRWGADFIPGYQLTSPHSNVNQVEFLVGIAF